MQQIDETTSEIRDMEDSPSAATIAEESAALRIPVLAEELVVQTTRVSRGAVQVHKGVTSEEQTLQVPLFHDEALIEHLTPDAYEAALAEDPDALFVPIYEEELVIEKRRVLKEYIRIRTRQVEEQRTVSELVRREYVEVREQPVDMADDR